MYVKIRVSSPYVGTERYYAFEVPDDFNEWPEDMRQLELDELYQEAISEYAETSEAEICEGDPADDEDCW